MMDFPQAFEFIKQTYPDKLAHHPKCSYRQAGMLCDCSIIWAEYYRREAQDLARWKREYLAVESQWNPQEIGRLLGVEWGEMIHRAIEPGIKRLIEERDRYKALVESADNEGGSMMWTSDHRKILAREVEKCRNTIPS
jgi:hypothetical protein